MKVCLFSVHGFEVPYLERANAKPAHELVMHQHRLGLETAALAKGCGAIAAFAGDRLDRDVLECLREQGVGLVTLRSAGFNHVDLAAAEDLGMTVLRVPAYSPYAIAEHALALMLTLNRKIHRAHARTREGNFQLEGLLGFDMHGKTVGVVGTGRIGLALVNILQGLGCQVLANDLQPDPGAQSLGVRYVELPELLTQSDIVSLHCPLTPATHHLIDRAAVEQLKPGAMLINTSRGAVTDAQALIAGLKSGRIGALGLDVYEEEADLFFRDLSDQVIQDDVFARLQTFPNVLITAHQAFFTHEALTGIAETTVANLSSWESGTVNRETVVDCSFLS